MAGTWMSIVEGFGGMQTKQSIALSPKFLKRSTYSFKINFRNQVITVSVNHQETISL
jgi:maltose phosphorylase